MIVCIPLSCIFARHWLSTEIWGEIKLKWRERENLQAEYIRFGLAIESGRVIWIEDSLTLHLGYKETVLLPNSNFGWKDVNSRN